MYTHVHTQIDTQIDRHTHSVTHTQTDRHAYTLLLFTHAAHTHTHTHAHAHTHTHGIYYMLYINIVLFISGGG
jgi:hypothetical protein